MELIGDPTLRDWFTRALRSAQELQLDEALGAVGLKAVVAQAKGADDKGGAVAGPGDAPDAAQPRAWLGAVLRERPSALEVGSVADGSPAQLAGVCAGDELVALDGFRSDLKQRLSRAQPGQPVRLGLFRMDELLEVPVTLAAAPRDTLTLVPDPMASADQLELRQKWLGEAWPPGD